MKSLLLTAREIYAWAKQETPSHSDLEVYVSQGNGRSVVWSEKKCEDVQQSQGGGVGLRVILRPDRKSRGGQQGYAFTTSFLKESVQTAARKAAETASLLPAEEFRQMPVPSNGAEARMPENDLYDSAVFSESLVSLMEQMKERESRLLKDYPLLKSVLRIGFGEGSGETVILNSNGVERNFPGTHVSLGVSCLAEKGSERQEGGFGQSKRFKSDLDWDRTFTLAADRTIALLGGKPIPSGAVPVVMDPSVACEFLSLVSSGVCADSVQKGKSPLMNKLGQSVASPLVTLVDDGALKRGIATSPYDDEGVPTQRTAVLTRGVLEHYLYDTYTALKDKTVSTGNAGRAGFKSSPSSGPSNFYLQAGATAREKLLKMTTGLYLYEVMGLHMADPVSGDFSVGVIGAWLEKGEWRGGVRGVTLAGNLLSLLKNIDCVCDDLTFFGSVGSPTFRVSELSVSGS
ncbi:MAG: TldD/PmbA family protein [Elusimicrobia bacterium]|nr:TldD/PmbA family protein [Elusimicrobiota bacterium]